MRYSGANSKINLSFKFITMTISLITAVACSSSSKKDASSAGVSTESSSANIGIVNELIQKETTIVRGKNGVNQGNNPNLPAGDATSGGLPAPESLDGATLTALLDPCKTTVLPLIEQHCSNCHISGGAAPTFLYGSPEESCQDFYATGKVNLLATERSPLFVRLEEIGHQCWTPEDCESNAVELKVQIDAWATSSKDQVDLIRDSVLKSSAASFVGAPDAESIQLGPTLIVGESEDAVLTGVWQNQALGDGGTAIYVDNANNCGNNVGFDGAAGANSRFTLNVEVPGTYYLHGRIAAPDGAADSFYYRIDDDVNQTYIFRPNLSNDAATAIWTPATQTNDVNDVLPAMMLTAGAHTIDVRCREPNTRVDSFAFSTTETLDGDVSAVETPEKMMSFDVSELCGVPATIDFRIADYSAESYRFRLPILKSESALKIKNMNVLLNGVGDTQYTTYTLLDKSVPANSMDPLEEGFMIVLKDKGTGLDEFNLTLEECVAE